MSCYCCNSVKVTHIPSGITGTCGEHRSQFRNRNEALGMVRSRLWAGHYGPPGPVIRTYDLIDDPERALEWLEGKAPISPTRPGVP